MVTDSYEENLAMCEDATDCLVKANAQVLQTREHRLGLADVCSDVVLRRASLASGRGQSKLSTTHDSLHWFTMSTLGRSSVEYGSRAGGYRQDRHTSQICAITGVVLALTTSRRQCMLLCHEPRLFSTASYLENGAVLDQVGRTCSAQLGSMCNAVLDSGG